jgi:hypothetical protein
MATDTEVSAVSAQIPANVAGKNFVINGGMDVAQRGTSLTGVNGYSLDRWLVNGFGTSSNISVGQYLISTLIPGLRYYMRVAPTTSNTQNFWISQSLETHEVIRLAGKQVTLSFYHRMPFAFTGTWSAAVSYSTGTDANLHYPASATSIFADNLSSSAAWQRYTKTFTVPSNATSFAIQLQSTNNVLGTAMFDLTGVQLEIGSVATDFSRSGGDFQGELLKCKRYYFEGFIAMISGGTNGIHGFQHMYSMRVTPSINFEYDSTNNRVYRMDNAARYDLVSPTIIATPNALTTMYAFTPAGWAGSAGIGFNAYWRFNAEL